MSQPEHPPTNLRCEYFTDPLCIDVPRPRLSWELTDPRQGARQTAYQLVVDDLWDSGKTASDQSIQLPYAGPELKSRQRCTWKVRVWDQNDQPSAWSALARWEMGFLQKNDWKAQWIAAAIIGGPYTSPPAPILRREFAPDKPIASARLYITALGLYECTINGKRVGDNVFVPGRTDYRKRVPYHAYDVAEHLRSSNNTLSAILGDGWYCGHLHSDPRMTYGDRPRLLAQLEITHTDGSTQFIVTDNSWHAAEGPIRSSDLLMGEDIDARIEPRDLRPVIVMPDPGIEIVAHRSPPPRRIEQRKPVGPPTISANKRRHVFDFGQNLVGHVRLRFRNAPPGKTIDLRHVEMLDKDGKPYTTALRTARATDHYTTRGSDEEFFEPRFTFHGFRYVEVRDYPSSDKSRNPQPDDLTANVIRSDLPTTGHFECSDPMLNQLQSNIVWSQRGNFLDIPTDCPQRDERLGWTGDAQVFIKTAAFNMNVAGFFTKWLQDVADAQFPDGHIPSVVPHVATIHHEGGPAWSDAAVICPWTIWQCYGDTRILEDCWPMMTRFMDYLAATCPDHIRPQPDAKWKGYGDWLSVNADTPPELIGTAFYAYCANLMSQMATAINKPDDAAKYASLFDAVRVAFQLRFVSSIGNPLTVQTQTAHVLALHFDLLPESLRQSALDALVKDIQSRDTHLSTGFVGTPYLNHVLTRFGRSDIAYALLMQKTYPSWLYPITQGATTMWERWDAWTHEKGFSDSGMNSFNHYAFGAVGDWMYSTIAGINPLSPGYRKILIRPIPGGHLTWARGSLRSPMGLIESDWNVEGNALTLNVTIPPNTTAIVELPNLTPVEVEPGKQTFRSERVIASKR